MNIPYAVSGAAIAGAVALATYHELPPLREPVLAETAAVKTNPEPPVSHPVRTIPIVASPVVAPAIVPHVAEAPEQRAIAAAIEPRTRRAMKTENPRKTSTGDVCARHGGQRVDDPARRSWHCVFPKRGAR